MNKQKLMYEAPTAQTFVVRFEGVICGSPNLLNSGNQTEYMDYDGYDEL